MNISEIRTRGVRPCSPKDDLATAATIMWECDCGALPVVDDVGRLEGMITDRDICIAVATRRRLASEIPVDEVMSGKTVSCSAEESVQTVLRRMREAQLRRLPIVDGRGRLKGMVTVTDLILAIRDMKAKAAREALLQEVILTLMAISQRRRSHELQLYGVRAMIPGA